MITSETRSNRSIFVCFFLPLSFSHIMKFLITGSFLFVAFATLAAAEEWSWGNDKTQTPAKPATEAATDRESKSIDSYSNINDDGSSEQSDASVPANETDTHPRHLIRDRLCGLGLMEVTLYEQYL